MKRREFLKLSLGTVAVAALSPRARAEAAPKEIRIGTQKGGFFPALKARHTLEDVFQPLGVEIKWVDFQFGPPLLEAINVGSVDFGYVGDSPSIFAQAANARIRYRFAELVFPLLSLAHPGEVAQLQVNTGPFGETIANAHRPLAVAAQS